MRKERTEEYRHPLYIADWKRSIPYVDNQIAEDDLDEPHIKRKHVILNKYPEIKTLFGVDNRTKYILALLLTVQLSIAYYFGHQKEEDYNGWVYALLVYVVGASLTQIFGTIIHEACHNLTSPSPFVNRMVGLCANICIPFPIAASFRRYHLEHHAYQGVYDKDPDLPLDWELYFVKGNPVMKALFLFFYPLMYVVRGVAMQKTPSNWELINLVWTLSADLILWNVLGQRGFMYLFYSLWFGYGIHPAGIICDNDPTAGHFVQEHYTWVDGQETYSYYGWLNLPFLNIGYHNEHHDFTQVPWSKLTDVRKIAPEFYNTLFYHMSWTMVLVDFIFDSKLGPQSRVGRNNESHRRGRKLKIPGLSRVDSGREIEKIDDPIEL